MITVQVPDDLDREDVDQIQQAAQDWTNAQYGDLEDDCG